MATVRNKFCEGCCLLTVPFNPEFVTMDVSNELAAAADGVKVTVAGVLLDEWRREVTRFRLLGESDTSSSGVTTWMVRFSADTPGGPFGSEVKYL